MKSYRQDKSPRREAINSELDDHSQRIKELLRADLTMLEEENSILKLKCKKVSELEEKTQLVLRQNSQLLSENEKMGRLLHQQKTENDSLKGKLDAYSSQRYGAANEFQNEKKRLLKEIQHLSDELNETEALKDSQIAEIKSQFQMELQATQRQFASAQNIYETEIRKLRQQLDKRQHEMAEYASKLKRNSSEAEYEILRLKEEKEKIKNELIYSEADRKKQIENLKMKLDENYLEEIEALKRTHLNNLEEIDMDNRKYKEMLEDRNSQIEDLTFKLSKQRTFYEETLTVMKREGDNYRAKMNELEKITDMELDEMKSRLSEMHENQIVKMQNMSQKQIDNLFTKIHQLEDTVSGKNAEMEQIVKEKSAARNLFDGEVGRLKEDVFLLQSKLREAETKISEITNRLGGKISDKQKHIEYIESVSRDQKEALEKEISILKGLIENSKQELDSQRMLRKENQMHLKQDIHLLKNQNATLKEALRQEKNQKEKSVNSLQGELAGASAQLTSKSEALIAKIKMIQKENQVLKNSIAIKDKEARNVMERLKSSEERERKLAIEIDELRSKMNKKDQKSNELMTEQKQRLENSFSYNIEHMRLNHEAALKLEANRNADLQQKLKKKERELDELLRRYKLMTDEIEILTHQEANKKDITLKYPGATADLIANKHLFDVFLKTKVLDVCGDALDKENKR